MELRSNIHYFWSRSKAHLYIKGVTNAKVLHRVDPTKKIIKVKAFYLRKLANGKILLDLEAQATPPNRLLLLRLLLLLHKIPINTYQDQNHQIALRV